METPIRTMMILIGSSLILLDCSRKLSTGNGQGSVTDSKGNKYSVRLMSDGRQWITENLKIDLPGSYCYNDSIQYCLKYGQLYTWEAARKGVQFWARGGACPPMTSGNKWQNITAESRTTAAKTESKRTKGLFTQATRSSTSCSVAHAILPEAGGALKDTDFSGHQQNLIVLTHGFTTSGEVVSLLSLR